MSMREHASVNVVIPTYQRAARIADAVEAALAQSWAGTRVTVVDDGSTDDTLDVLARYADHPRFRLVALERNVGTARAKNVAIALNDCEFMTFHDSDDMPLPHKVERQVRVAIREDIGASPVLNWSLCDIEPDSNVRVDLVVNEHELVFADGARHHVRRALSLVDDVFPNLQMAAGPPGDWILVNCGLFRASVFDALGGFRDGIEEDRDIRNRLLFDGRVVWLVPEILMIKHECEDSLTVAGRTGYDSERRRADRARVWREASAFLGGTRPRPEPIRLEGLRIRRLVGLDASVTTPSGASMTPATRRRLAAELNRHREVASDASARERLACDV